ncbi:MAG TPA: hypothetical protein VM143_05115, partial [Acidimicrobiales bacterium]|nr:hypothetical protein [Acidimicrobiales bacterium]
ELSVVEPSLTYTTAASTDFKIVSLASSGAATWAAAALSKSGTCYLIKDDSGAGGGTKYGTNATCTGTQALTSATLAKW